MAIDKDRYNAFNAEIAELQDSLEFETFYEVFKAKLFDWVSSLGSSGPDYSQRLLAREVSQLFSPELAKYANDILGSYNTVLERLNDRYEDLGNNVERDFSRVRAIEKLTEARLGQYKKSTVASIAKVLRADLLAGENSKTIAKNLRAKVDGKANFYADTIARTGVKGYSRAAKYEKALIGEVFFLEYVGIIRKGTREFCRIMRGTTHHIDDIKRMKNGNLEPVETFCGGWRCHHDWEPDPFAKQGTGGNWQERKIGKKTLRVYSEDDIEKFFDEAV